MCSSGRIGSAVSLALLLALGACEQTATSLPLEVGPQFQWVESSPTTGFDPAVAEALVRRIDDFNATLAEAGQSIRLDYPWMFVVGRGTDPFQRLRTGSRWPIESPGYILDESDFTTDLPAGVVAATLESAFDTWNDVPQSYLRAIRLDDPGSNFDVLDGTYDDAGDCVDLFDVTSPNLDQANETITPEADIVMGGWPPVTYFSQCLGSEDIIGVTWTFSDSDTDGDQYRDRLYVEQFYNPAFDWVTSGSTFLVFDSGVDLETIAGHENGHAHGLGHFGGPVRTQPFSLKPNGRVFNPEAVMNPFYLFGEKRVLSATDEAALRTLYAGPR